MLSCIYIYIYIYIRIEHVSTLVNYVIKCEDYEILECRIVSYFDSLLLTIIVFLPILQYIPYDMSYINVI
jgi:hypothetical protein